MINREFAEQFIHRIRSTTDYNVNIMNEHGIIIASCNEERIGTFHAAAFKMISENTGVNITNDVTDDLPGVTSPGVNLLLTENMKPVGVIGVSGEPALVMPLAKIIKLSFESLYDYEMQKLFSPSASRGNMSRLARLLFIDRPVNIVRVRALAEELGICENINRYPVLIEYNGRENAEQVLRNFAMNYPEIEYYSQNDLLFPMGGNLILMFKHVDEMTVSTYRRELSVRIDKIDSWFESQVKGKRNYYVCGTVQNNFQYYGKIYEYVMWLYRYRQKKEARIYFLADYLTEFMMSHIPSETLAPILDIHARLIRDNMDEKIFCETVGALISNGMNLNDAAKSLCLHKNTVALRMKKIREILGINPLTNMRDAVFITAIYNYINT